VVARLYPAPPTALPPSAPPDAASLRRQMPLGFDLRRPPPVGQPLVATVFRTSAHAGTGVCVCLFRALKDRMEGM